MTDDYWEVDDRNGTVRGRNTGVRFRIGDVVIARIVKVNVPRRELNLAIIETIARSGRQQDDPQQPVKKPKKPLRKGAGKKKRIAGGPKRQVLKRNRRRHS